jgi:mono/diheme cytochrome c family protein
MKKRTIIFISILVLIVMAGILLAACGSSSSTPPSSGGTTGGSTDAGQTLMEQRCSVCHSPSRVTSAQKTAAQWKATVDKMINNGAQLSPAEEQTLVNYLAQTYHP